MERVFKGRTVWQFGDNYNADLIVGSKHISTTDKEVLGKVCLADHDPDFLQKIAPGDLMIAGKNFGYGHPHYQGIISLQRNQISTVIAESFYPLWYRVAVFYAFPAIVCPGISTQAKLGDVLSVDVETGRVENRTTGASLQGEPIHPQLLRIMEDGGLPAHLKKRALAAAAQKAEA
jgi:3-isopropylmalate/(R)-2-methylmalate dehydratase small subunit